MKKTVCLLFLLLTACTATAPTPTTTPTAVPPTASPTIEPTPTPDVQAQVFAGLQDREINVAHDASLPNGQYDLLLNGEPVPGAFYDASGLHIDAGGQKIDVPANLVLERVNIVDGAIIVNNLVERVAVFDPTIVGGKEFLGEHFDLADWKDRWVARSEVVSTNPNKPVEIDTWEDYFAITHYEKHFIEPNFPADVYFPPSDKIHKEYATEPGDHESEFNSITPLGKLANLSKSIFTMGVNNVIFLPNEKEGRKVFECVSTEAVAEKGGVWSGFHFSNSWDTRGECLNFLKERAGNVDKKFFMLPIPFIEGDDMKIASTERNRRIFWGKFGFLAPNGDLIRVKPLVLQWLNEWKVPDELKVILVSKVWSKWRQN
jgi:hypothetical protein